MPPIEKVVIWKEKCSYILFALVRSLGNLGFLVFAFYALHIVQRSFGPRPKVISRKFRKSAPSDFAPEKQKLSILAQDVASNAEARITRSLTGVGSEEPV